MTISNFSQLSKKKMALVGKKATVESCVRRFHVYQDVWVPVIGETLLCRRETDNSEDRYAVAYYKSEEVVGHVPWKISCLCAAFLRRDEAMKGTVTGTCRYSSDLEQGGMEIPCLWAHLQSCRKCKSLCKCIMGSGYFLLSYDHWCISVK